MFAFQDEAAMKKKRLSLDLRVALVYLLFGGAWILFSDRLLADMVRDPAELTRLQTYKGWVFVFASALVIFLLLRRELKLRGIAEARLEESQDRFKHTFEISNAGKSITLIDGKISVNKAFADMLGYTREELEGKTWQELTPPDEIETIQSLLAPLLKGEKASTRFVKRYIHKDGSFVWTDVSVALQRDRNNAPLYFVTTIVDITKQKQAEEKLRLSEDLFSKAFHTSPAGLTITRIADGTFVDANEAFCTMFGFTREEVIGRTSTELNLWTPEERKKIIEEQLKTGGLYNFQLRARAKSGKVVDILFSSNPIEVRGELHHITTMIDITARREAEEELRLNRDRLAKLSRKLLEVQEAERRTLGRELHDQFGQILTAIKLTLETAAVLPAHAAQAKLTQALELTNDLLTRTSRLSLDLRPPMLDDFGLVPALLWHVNRFQEQSGIQVAFTHHEVQGRRFAAEIETAAYRTIQEALTNAARHAGATRVRLEVRAGSGELTIEIEDDGKGFDPHQALAKRHGLSSMRERVQLAGGTLQIESRAGDGARLFIRLPLEEAQP